MILELQHTNEAFMKSNVYYQKPTSRLVQEKGRVPIETAFTQVYDPFAEIILQVKAPICAGLLFWILTQQMNSFNGFVTGRPVFEEFGRFLQDRNLPTVSRSTFDIAIKELYNLGAITRVGRGHYYANPHLFWRGSECGRREFIKREAQDGSVIAINPTSAPTGRNSTARLSKSKPSSDESEV